jgi:hypothetical protein
LKEILRVDSSKIVKLKTAIEMLEKKSLNYLTAVRILKRKLATASHDVSVLKREREMLLEHETEHLETIRILKQEVDMLTREDRVQPLQKDHDEENKPSKDQEELRQLRLENQLFASQIVDYEAELNCVSFMEKEQEKLQQRVELMQRKLSDRCNNSEDDQFYDEACGSSIDESAQRENRGLSEETIERQSFCNPEQQKTPERHPIPELSLDQDEADAIKRSEERRKRLMEQLLTTDASADCEETKQSENGSEVNGEGTQSDRHSSDVSSQASMWVLRDHVLGMFTMNTTSEDGTQLEKREIYVVHDQEIPVDKETAENEVKFLQWQTPESLPSYVTKENIAMVAKKNLQVAQLSNNSACTPTKMVVQEFSALEVEKQRQASDGQTAEGRDTMIDVLESGDASEAIEVQLSPLRCYDDANKENDGGSRHYLCDDNCDAWSAVSDCLLFRTHDNSQ